MWFFSSHREIRREKDVKWRELKMPGQRKHVASPRIAPFKENDLYVACTFTPTLPTTVQQRIFEEGIIPFKGKEVKEGGEEKMVVSQMFICLGGEVTRTVRSQTRRNLTGEEMVKTLTSYEPDYITSNSPQTTALITYLITQHTSNKDWTGCKGKITLWTFVRASQNDIINLHLKAKEAKGRYRLTKKIAVSKKHVKIPKAIYPVFHIHVHDLNQLGQLVTDRYAEYEQQYHHSKQ